MTLLINEETGPRRRDRRDGDALLPRAELGKLRRWLAHSAATSAEPPPATPSVFDALRIAPPQRRETGRTPAAADVLVRRIGACCVGVVEPAALHDVSDRGVALRLGVPVEIGQRLHVEVAPPPGLPRRLFRRGDRAVQLLVVARHCRPTTGGEFLVGCGVGVDLADSLADAMLPADRPTRRLSA